VKLRGYPSHDVWPNLAMPLSFCIVNLFYRNTYTTRMEVTASAYCLKFVVMLMAILSTVGTTPLCPSRCECLGGAPDTSLTIDCHGDPDIDRGQLSQHIDSLLSSNLSYGHVTRLAIRKTPLTHVPTSVCRLTTLTQLHLDYNRLTRLPDNCLSNLTALTSLTASNNAITELQDGLFDGLNKLVTLKLHKNQISSIGLRVFNGSSMLTSLREVQLTSNRLHTLEPWPYYVGINGELWHESLVDLRSNNISTFTNKMGWKAKCGMKKMYVYLILSYNRIKHISDILRGWNVDLITWLCCLSSPRQVLFINRNNFFECDCVDFDIYRLVSYPPLKTTFLSNTYCSTPEGLHGRRVTSVPLDQFVCELTNRCPSGCRCVHRPANATLHVYCSNADLTALPLELPELPKSYTKYKLDFSNNRRLRHLERRPYFVNTSSLELSNCNIDSIDLEVWSNLANITQVFLDGNQLQSLPSLVATVSLRRTKFSLGRNPWKCSCDARWMSEWLKSVRSSLINPNDITCSSPSRLKNRNIMSVSREVFCADPASKAVKRALSISLSSVFGVLAVLLSVGIIVYRLRVRLYSRWKFHPFDRDECLGEDLVYDVFLSCSSSDNLPHGNEIRQQLERRGYRVCYPPRDFVPGETIFNNIGNAVVRSKRTVCFLTSQFLQRYALLHSFVEPSWSCRNILIAFSVWLIILCV